MPRLNPGDLDRIRDGLFFEGPERGRKLSRFWLLLGLSGIIAAAGVISDSTATVIGAMIVAPLMTPILGVAFALRLGDAPNFRRSLELVVAGATAVIAVGLVFGFAIRWDVVASSNSQVAARVSPHLIDLIAALATGAVGAIALARSDISDTLPGVAIAISLVPPLSVVGLTMSAAAWSESGGALTLFLTNVAAILASGSAVLAFYRVSRETTAVTVTATPWQRWRSTVAIAALLLIVVVPLTRSTLSTGNAKVAVQHVSAVARPWAREAGCVVVSVLEHEGVVFVNVIGPAPGPDVSVLHAQLVQANATDEPVKVGFVAEQVTPVG